MTSRSVPFDRTTHSLTAQPGKIPARPAGQDPRPPTVRDLGDQPAMPGNKPQWNTMVTAMDDGTRLVIGLDLDLTLVNTRASTCYALTQVNRELGLSIDAEAFVSRLGPPIREELGRWVPDEMMDQAVEAFRRSFTSKTALSRLEALPGADILLRQIDAMRGSTIVITSRMPAIAKAILRQCSLHSTAVIGGVSGEAKAPAMIEHGIALYAGDHPLDMIGAKAARVPAVGIATGSHGPEQLKNAGAVEVFDSLDQFSNWLRSGTQTEWRLRTGTASPSKSR